MQHVIRAPLCIQLVLWSHTQTQHPLIYSMLSYPFPPLFEFPFYSIFFQFFSVQLVLVVLRPLLLLLLLSLHPHFLYSPLPSPLPPLPAAPSLGFVSCSPSLSLALSPWQHHQPPQRPSLFTLSRLCAAVTVIFLSNICFFHLQISSFPPPPSPIAATTVVHLIPSLKS